MAALVSGFTGQTCSEATLRETRRQGDKRLSIVETNRSTRHTSSPRQIRAARAKWLADVGPIELIGREQRSANSRDASTQHHCPGLLFILIVTDYSLLCPL